MAFLNRIISSTASEFAELLHPQETNTLQFQFSAEDVALPSLILSWELQGQSGSSSEQRRGRYCYERVGSTSLGNLLSRSSCSVRSTQIVSFLSRHLGFQHMLLQHLRGGSQGKPRFLLFPIGDLKCSQHHQHVR